jgi:hypothetical protein
MVHTSQVQPWIKLLLRFLGTGCEILKRTVFNCHKLYWIGGTVFVQDDLLYRRLLMLVFKLQYRLCSNNTTGVLSPYSPAAEADLKRYELPTAQDNCR